MARQLSDRVDTINNVNVSDAVDNISNGKIRVKLNVSAVQTSVEMPALHRKQTGTALTADHAVSSCLDRERLSSFQSVFPLTDRRTTGV